MHQLFVPELTETYLIQTNMATWACQDELPYGILEVIQSTNEGIKFLVKFNMITTYMIIFLTSVHMT